MLSKKDKNTEKIIKTVRNALEAEGHETKRFSDSKKYMTTAYDTIVFKGADGEYYELTISNCENRRNPKTNRIEYKNETFDNI